VYAASELFEIKPAGAAPTVPVPWGAPQPSAVSGARSTTVAGGAVVAGVLAMLL
jgi:hypothetical protein